MGDVLVEEEDMMCRVHLERERDVEATTKGKKSDGRKSWSNDGA